MGRTWTIDDPELPRVLRGMAGSLCPAWFSREDREDVAQEAQCRLWQRGDLPDGSKREFNSAFLWPTVTYVRNELGRRKREFDIVSNEPNPPGSSPDPNPIPDPESPDPDPQQAAVARESGEAAGRVVSECLKALKSEEERCAVMLRLAGFKNREIAHRLRWSGKTVENRVYRGLEKLRECLPPGFLGR